MRPPAPAPVGEDRPPRPSLLPLLCCCAAVVCAGGRLSGGGMAKARVGVREWRGEVGPCPCPGVDVGVDVGGLGRKEGVEALAEEAEGAAGPGGVGAGASKEACPHSLSRPLSWRRPPGHHNTGGTPQRVSQCMASRHTPQAGTHPSVAAGNPPPRQLRPPLITHSPPWLALSPGTADDEQRCGPLTT